MNAWEPERLRFFITAGLDAPALQTLSGYGDITYEPMRLSRRQLFGDELAARLQGSDIFITELDWLTGDVIERLPSLRLVCDCRAAPTNLDIPAATACGIPVLTTPGRNAESVAELTVCLLLMLARRIPQVTRLFKERTGEETPLEFWEKVFFSYPGCELWGKTIGLIGLGAIGSQVAERLVPFGARVIACDPNQQEETFTLCKTLCVELDDLLRQSDFISLHAAASPGALPLLSGREFNLMKPGAFLVNTARAALVDEDALVSALQTGRLAGVAVDVYNDEPPPVDHPLLHMENVIALPHIGGNPVEIPIHQSRIAIPDLERILQGNEPRHCANPETLPHFFAWLASRPKSKDTPSGENLT